MEPGILSLLEVNPKFAPWTNPPPTGKLAA